MRIKHAVWKVYINWSSARFFFSHLFTMKLVSAFERTFHSRRSEGHVRRMHGTHTNTHSRGFAPSLLFAMHMHLLLFYKSSLEAAAFVVDTFKNYEYFMCIYKWKPTEIRQPNNGNSIYLLAFTYEKRRNNWQKIRMPFEGNFITSLYLI